MSENDENIEDSADSSGDSNPASKALARGGIKQSQYEAIFDRYGLNELERVFIMIYVSPLGNFNGARSMLFAEGNEDTDDYAERVAASQRAKRCLAKRHINSAMYEVRRLNLMRHDDIVDNLLTNWVMASNFDIATICDEDGMVKNLHDIPPDVRKMITSIKYKETGVEVKLQDGQTAQRMLAEAMGLIGKNRLGEDESVGDAKFATILEKAKAISGD